MKDPVFDRLLRVPGRAQLARLVAPVLGIVVLGWGVWAASVVVSLELRGQTVRAEIVERGSTRSSSGTGSAGHHVVYRFEAEGRIVQRRQSVTGRMHDALPPGSEVNVVYLPGRPQSHRLEGTGSVVPVLTALAVGILTLAFTLGPGLRVLREIPGRVRALAAPARGAQVTGHVHLPSGRFQTGRIALRWRDETGAEGQSGPVPPASAPPPGSRIDVRVDPVTGRGWWESELAPPPDPAHPAGARCGRARWPGALPALAALVLAGVSIWMAFAERREYRAILGAGLPVQAQVTARRMDHAGDWWLAWEFTTSDGQLVQGEGAARRQIAPGAQADPHRPGTALTVLHLPDDPWRSQAETAPEPGRRLGWIVVAVAAGIAGLGIGALTLAGTGDPLYRASGADRPATPLRLRAGAVLGHRALWAAPVLAVLAIAAWWLAEAGPRADRALWPRAAELRGEVTGRAIGGRVMGTDTTTGLQQRAILFFLDYRFEVVPGQPQAGRSRVFAVEYDRLQPGSSVLVRVHPDNPELHALALAAPTLHSWYLRSLSVILGCAALIAAISAGFGLRSQARAARSGIAREVEVIAHRKGFAGHSSFGWADAEDRRGWAPGMPRARLPAIGSKLRLRIDPRGGYGWPEDRF